MKIGIFGGSFNPIHNGHIYLAKTVMSELKLDKVIFVPSRIPPHKSGKEYISGKDRLEMVRLAIRNNPCFEVSDYELSNDRTGYSIYTVIHFRKLYPNDLLYLMIGSDMLLSFDTWFEFEKIMQNVTVAAVSRCKGDNLLLIKKVDELSKYGKVIVCNADAYPVSSTEIRKKIRKKENWSCYLDGSVVQYIRLGSFYDE